MTKLFPRAIRSENKNRKNVIKNELKCIFEYRLIQLHTHTFLHSLMQRLDLKNLARPWECIRPHYKEVGNELGLAAIQTTYEIAYNAQQMWVSCVFLAQRFLRLFNENTVLF